MKNLPMDIAKAALDDVVAGDEYNILYDIYDQGFDSADAVQDAIENYKRKIDEVVERLRSYRT